MENNLTELIFLLDRSGSMAGLEQDTIGGFNAMIAKQKKQEGPAFVTTVLFDHQTKIIHDRVDLQAVRPMTEEDYEVRGSTALLDALGWAIRHIRSIHRYARKEDVPGRTLFVITTDGMENASRNFDLQQVRTMIEAQKEQGWEFLFLGANIDAVATARSFGIREDRAVNYCCDAEGTELNYQAISRAVSDVRACRPLSANWKKDIEDNYKKRG